MKLTVFNVFFFSLLTMFIVRNVVAQNSEAPPRVPSPVTIDETVNGTDEANKAEDSTTLSKTKTSKKDQNKPPQKAFKPSEEISEDRPVPFPVDI